LAAIKILHILKRKELLILDKSNLGRAGRFVGERCCFNSPRDEQRTAHQYR
jgi:hypothetical protein